MVRPDCVHYTVYHGVGYGSHIYFGECTETDLNIFENPNTHANNYHGVGGYRINSDVSGMYTGAKFFQVNELEVFEALTIKPYDLLFLCNRKF